MGFFEFGMLLCFGFSWPFSIVRHWKGRTAKGQSLAFLLLIALGYVFGITHKLLHDPNWVTWVYAALLCIVSTEIAIYARNRRFDAIASRPQAPGEAQDAAGRRNT